jgi:hypothetical protein
MIFASYESGADYSRKPSTGAFKAQKVKRMGIPAKAITDERKV